MIYKLIGSHNSYKKAIEKPLWDSMYRVDSARAIALQYAHIPLNKQLDLGLRSLELDVFYDPKGGHFVNPNGISQLKAKGNNLWLLMWNRN